MCIVGMLSGLDKSVGRIVAALDANQLRENTIIIFMSDVSKLTIINVQLS